MPEMAYDLFTGQMVEVEETESEKRESAVRPSLDMIEHDRRLAARGYDAVKAEVEGSGISAPGFGRHSFYPSPTIRVDDGGLITAIETAERVREAFHRRYSGLSPMYDDMREYAIRDLIAFDSAPMFMTFDEAAELSDITIYQGREFFSDWKMPCGEIPPRGKYRNRANEANQPGDQVWKRKR